MGYNQELSRVLEDLQDRAAKSGLPKDMSMTMFTDYIRGLYPEMYTTLRERTEPMPNILDREDMHIDVQRMSSGDLVVNCDVNFLKLQKEGKASGGWVYFYGTVPKEEVGELLLKLAMIPPDAEKEALRPKEKP